MTLEEIEKGVENLSREELSRFRAWFLDLDLDSRVWDREIEEDAAAGRLDHLAEEAISDHESRRS